MKRFFSSTANLHRGFGSVNRVFLVGTVGKAPQVRELPNSDANHLVASFSLATGESVKNHQSGQYERRTDWHSVSVNNSSLADFTRKHITQGTKVCVQGSLKYKEVGKDDQKRVFTNIVVGYDGDITVLSAKDMSSSEQQSSADQPTRGTR